MLAFTVGSIVAQDNTTNIHNNTIQSSERDLYINWTGHLRYGEYNITLTRDIKHDNNVTGTYAGVYMTNTEPKRIEILTGREASRIEELCTHEVLHSYFPDFRHKKDPKRWKDPIYKLEDNTEFQVCEQLVEKAVKHQYG
jgi:hypothetical protein